MREPESFEGQREAIVVSRRERHRQDQTARRHAELAKTITETSRGQYTIKQTTLYSALKRLEAAGAVSSYAGTSASGKPRTYYRLTADGAAHLADKLVEWEATRTLIDHFAQVTASREAQGEQ